MSARLSTAVLETLTHWATAFEGGCSDGRQQYARPGHLRSGCRSCAAALDGWDRPGPCDLCGAVCQPGGAWTLPPQLTGGVAVLLRVCDRCSVHELSAFNNEENEMTTNPMTCCGACMQTFAEGVTGGRQGHDFSTLHEECRQALSVGLKGYGRRTTDRDLAARIRVVLAARALGGAA